MAVAQHQSLHHCEPSPNTHVAPDDSLASHNAEVARVAMGAFSDESWLLEVRPVYVAAVHGHEQAAPQEEASHEISKELHIRTECALEGNAEVLVAEHRKTRHKRTQRGKGKGSGCSRAQECSYADEQAEGFKGCPREQLWLVRAPDALIKYWKL